MIRLQDKNDLSNQKYDFYQQCIIIIISYKKLKYLGFWIY